MKKWKKNKDQVTGLPTDPLQLSKKQGIRGCWAPWVPPGTPCTAGTPVVLLPPDSGTAGSQGRAGPSPGALVHWELSLHSGATSLSLPELGLDKAKEMISPDSATAAGMVCDGS